MARVGAPRSRPEWEESGFADEARRHNVESAGVIFASREVPRQNLPVILIVNMTSERPRHPAAVGPTCHFSPYREHLNWRLTSKLNWYMKSLHSDKRSETAGAVFVSLPCLFAWFSNSLILFAAEVNEAKEAALRGLSASKRK